MKNTIKTELIENFIKDNNLSKSKFCKMCKISQSTLNKIMTKYYNKWRQTKYVKEYNDAYLEYYLDENDLDAKTKAELISKNYTYGYVENPPYEEMVNGKVAGIAGEYVDRVARLSGINFKYKKYDSVADLKKAIDKGEIVAVDTPEHLEKDTSDITVIKVITEITLEG